jgi:hypothetical protein
MAAVPCRVLTSNALLSCSFCELAAFRPGSTSLAY